MVIEGFYWFVGALVICGVHVLYLLSWRREVRQQLAWWQQYDTDTKQRHVEFMKAISADTQEKSS